MSKNILLSFLKQNVNNIILYIFILDTYLAGFLADVLRY